MQLLFSMVFGLCCVWDNQIDGRTDIQSRNRPWYELVGQLYMTIILIVQPYNYNNENKISKFQ